VLDLLVTNVSELIGGMRVGGSLGRSDHTLVEFAVLRDMGQMKSKVRTLNFRKVFHTRMLSIEHKSSRSIGARNQERKGRDWHG